MKRMGKHFLGFVKHALARIGENEIKENKINLKNMLTGEQCLVSLDELLEKFR